MVCILGCPIKGLSVTSIVSRNGSYGLRLSPVRVLAHPFFQDAYCTERSMKLLKFAIPLIRIKPIKRRTEADYKP